MTQPSSAPTLASVVFLQLQEFSRRAITEQAKLRTQLEAVVGVAISLLPVEDRILLDTPDGAAVVVLANPRGAIEVAERALAAATGLPLCIGVNHGVIQFATDEHQTQGLVGDGIASAATVASFAQPSGLLVSRSFRDALAESAPDREDDLRPAGVYTDSRVRTHELFVPDIAVAVSRYRRRLVIGIVCVIGILGSAALLRETVLKNRIENQSAVLVFAISPRGDIYIDDEARGKSPPLTQIRLAPGSHSIEVRNGANPPFKRVVDIKAGEQMTIKHIFAASSGDAFRDFRKKLGL